MGSTTSTENLFGWSYFFLCLGTRLFAEEQDNEARPLPLLRLRSPNFLFPANSAKCKLFVLFCLTLMIDASQCRSRMF
jgi:hypothetical protein